MYEKMLNQQLLIGIVYLYSSAIAYSMGHGPWAWAEHVKCHHLHVTIVNVTNFKIVTSAVIW